MAAVANSPPAAGAHRNANGHPLQLPAQLQLSDAYSALRRDSDRPVVGYLRLATGSHITKIDEVNTLKVVLADLFNGLGASLADLFQVRRYLANHLLTLGIAIFEALDIITGMSFNTPVKETSMPFTAESSHALEKF
ncbi:hypothetical protein H310_14982 [Aphanomyces invadans]|uniref:Uncharacterized protein n=1 Tax=Aphanomyces invadans TaxID=157072 RepID=A0A024T810_9STRA|nr:hypothetical protein H310_14982 [Aphanomyces invadans]ETV90185.1 hypothetical protein H310_14982 [Aphanomyces invadans]|eukprot:XP_008881184.1 hypothetical protein H310_14982 [Aphanomyces invadans]